MKFGLGYDWKELKRFQKLDKKDRSIVFYLESEHSFIVFKPIIEKLTQEYDMKICYVTSSKTDPMLTCNDKNILPFYIGDGVACVSFFVNLKATIMVMTMPDLGTFHIKRSKIYPVHYVYIFHSVHSTHYGYTNTAFDNFDTIFCTGNYQITEIQERERKFNLKEKKLVKIGHGWLDTLIDEVQSANIRKNTSKNKVVLIAPTRGSNGLIETKCQEIIHILLDSGFDVILRPHPTTIKKSNQVVQKIEKEFKNHLNFKLETDIRNTESLFLCDCMISDWSGVAIEYAFALEKPVLYVDIPKKINNHDYNDLEIIPLEEKIRSQIGAIISPLELSNLSSEIENLCLNIDQNRKKIQTIKEENVFNLGKSEKYGAMYLLEFLAGRNEN